MRVKITRFQTNDKSTYGDLEVINGEGKVVFKCKTLERGWLNNKPSVSCIPAGIYEVVKTYSNRFDRMLYLVKNVPKRAGIRLHSANYSKQLNGCIAFGSAFSDINGDREMDIINSNKTHQQFDRVMNDGGFRLEIINQF